MLQQLMVKPARKTMRGMRTTGLHLSASAAGLHSPRMMMMRRVMARMAVPRSAWITEQQQQQQMTTQQWMRSWMPSFEQQQRRHVACPLLMWPFAHEGTCKPRCCTGMCLLSCCSVVMPLHDITGWQAL